MATKTPKMTRAHFALIAAALYEAQPAPGGNGYSAWRNAVSEFAVRLPGTNPNFNLPQFLEACGVDAECPACDGKGIVLAPPENMDTVYLDCPSCGTDGK